MGATVSRRFLVVPNERLRCKCEPIGTITPFVRELAGELVAFLGVEHQGLVSVGVSAPQFGESVRMFALRVNPYSRVPDSLVLINPVLVYGKGSCTLSEQCFSIPDTEFMLRRYKIVKVRGMTLAGCERSLHARGVVAQAIQHELNHLDGVLIDTLGGSGSEQ